MIVGQPELNFKADILQFSIELQRVLSTFTADTRFFGATKRGPEVAQKPTVHPGNSTVDPCRNLVCFLDVLSPQRGSKAVFCIVGEADYFINVVKWSYVTARAEDLLFDNLAGFVQSGP